MNKRQAKKAFKKKYGYNPGQLEKDMINFIDECKIIIPVACELIKKGFKDMHDSYDRVIKEYLKSI